MALASRIERKAAVLLSIRERERLENVGIRAAKSLAQRTMSSVTRSFASGRGDPNQMVQQGFIPDLTELLMDGMTATHLQGNLRTVRFARQAIASNSRGLQGVYEESVAFTKRRLALSDIEVAAIRDQFGPQALEIAGNTGAVINERLALTLAEATEAGLTRVAAIERLGEQFVASGLAPANPHLLNQVFRTQMQMAYSAGRHQAQLDPAVQEVLWGFEYFTIGDDQVRDNHEAMNGTILPKEDPAWASITPPNGYNCRCERLEVYFEEIASGDAVPKPLDGPVVVDEQPVLPAPDPGWAFNPGEIFAVA